MGNPICYNCTPSRPRINDGETKCYMCHTPYEQMPTNKETAMRVATQYQKDWDNWSDNYVPNPNKEPILADYIQQAIDDAVEPSNQEEREAVSWLITHTSHLELGDEDGETIAVMKNIVVGIESITKERDALREALEQAYINMAEIFHSAGGSLTGKGTLLLAQLEIAYALAATAKGKE